MCIIAGTGYLVSHKDWYGVILYSIYRGREKVNLPWAALTAGPPLQNSTRKFIEFTEATSPCDTNGINKWTQAFVITAYSPNIVIFKPRFPFQYH